MSTHTNYIIKERQRRESVATQHLLEVMPISERLLGPLGLSRFCWAILELRLSKVIPDTVGEIDIVAGPLHWADPTAFDQELLLEQHRWQDAHPTVPEFMAAKTVAHNAGIAWPPTLDYLVGVEVKCAYNEQGTIRSDKTSQDKVKGIRRQLTRDLDLGLDRVALVDIIAHQPSTGVDGAAWLIAGAHAQSSIEAMRPTLAARLPSESLAGQFVWSIGSVTGGDETIRGAGAPILLRPAQPNSRSVDRNLFERGIRDILRGIP